MLQDAISNFSTMWCSSIVLCVQIKIDTYKSYIILLYDEVSVDGTSYQSSKYLGTYKVHLLIMRLRKRVFKMPNRSMDW